MKGKVLLTICFILFAFVAKATVYGPYSMDSSVPQPEGHTKVVVFSQPGSIAGYIILENVTTGEQVTLTATAYTQCFYYVESGTYEVVEIEYAHDAFFGGVYMLDIGDSIILSGGAAIVFRRGLIEEY